MTNRDKKREFEEAKRRIARVIGHYLTPAEERRLHDEITGGDYSLEEIVDIGIAMFLD